MALVACMGGWCGKRDVCRLYHQTTAKLLSERLCEPGRHDSYEPVRIFRDIGTWEWSHASLMATARWTDPIH